MKQDLYVFIAMTPWESDYMSTTKYLAKELSKESHVIYIDYHYTLKDCLKSLLYNKKPGLKSLFLNRKKLFGNISVINLFPGIPYLNIKNKVIFSVLHYFNKIIVKLSLKKFKILFSKYRVILINAFNPFVNFSTKPDLHIYYSYDDIGNSDGLHLHGERLEQKMVRSADMVVTSSDELYKKQKGVNPNTELIMNGVDFSHFSKAKDYHPFTNNNVIYLGSLDERIDYKFLLKLSIKLPDIKFIFAGRLINKDAQVLTHQKNITLMGPIDYSEIPAILATAKVGIIPFKCNEFNRHLNPLKINEYFAAGLDIVSTAFSKDIINNPYISYTNDINSFSMMIRKKLSANINKKAKEQYNYAMENSWANKTNKLKKSINTLRRIHV